MKECIMRQLQIDQKTWGYEQVQELVRCKDCKYGQRCTEPKGIVQCFKWNSGEFGELHEPDWFCADGERRMEDGEKES